MTKKFASELANASVRKAIGEVHMALAALEQHAELARSDDHRRLVDIILALTAVGSDMQRRPT
jgi:hypothetical protein